MYTSPSPLSPAATVTFDEAEETVKLEFPSQLSPGEATLVLEYTGKLNDQMRGFYRSKYTDPTSPGTEKYAATTQFEVLLSLLLLPSPSPFSLSFYSLFLPPSYCLSLSSLPMSFLSFSLFLSLSSPSLSLPLLYAGKTVRTRLYNHIHLHYHHHFHVEAYSYISISRVPRSV